MFNTRKKALEFAKICREKAIKMEYVTSGIRKCDREIIINRINNSKKVTVISTQTLEAGVDLDFDNILRELAPLDSIVQVMGRLNREANSKEATLVVFKIQGDNNYWTPYNKYYIQKSQELLEKIEDSEGLYDNLANYYKEIYDNDQSGRKDEKELEDSIRSVDFDSIYSKVRQVFYEDYYDTIFVPRDDTEYNLMKKEFSGIRIAAKVYKRYAKTQAKLPNTIYKLDFERHLDPDLLKSDVFLLKNLNEYNPQLGFDTQIDKINSNNVRNRIY
jgi:CRISPR-associated endonuclease/helicase Cas3